MKIELSTEQAAERIQAVYDGTNFSFAGAYALAEYLEELEEDAGETINLDPVAIACEYGEHESLQDWLTDHYSMPLCEALACAGIDIDGDETEDDIDDLLVEYIMDRGDFVPFEGGVIVSKF